MRPTALLVLCMLGVYPPAILAVEKKDPCQNSEEALCLYHVEEQTSSKVDIFARNSREFDISIELSLRLTNMSSDTENRGFVVAGKTEVRLTTLSVQNPSKGYGFQYDTRSTPGNMYASHDDDVRYRLPFEPGSGYYVSQSCDGKLSHNKDHSRAAIDFAVPIGTKVHAIRGGRVVNLYEVSISGGTSTLHLDEGNFIEIRHSDGSVASYHHLRTMGVRVELGEQVVAGQFIGYSGDTGFASGPHLHVNVQVVEPSLQTLSVPVTWLTRRGEIVCPRRGLNLKAVAAG